MEAGLSTIYDAITTAEREALTALGVHAELAGVFIGADGRPLGTPLDSRMIVTPAALFTQIPFVLAVAYDAAKSHAVRAAIRGGLVHGLVTHTSLARALLSWRGPAGRKRLARARRTTAASRCRAGPPTGAGSSESATPCAGPRPRAGAPPTRCSTTWRAAGFDGAPRVLATGPASETLSYLEGRAAVPPLAAETLTDDALVSVADLLRRYHQAAASFDPARYDWPRPVPSATAPAW